MTPLSEGAAYRSVFRMVKALVMPGWWMRIDGGDPAAFARCADLFALCCRKAFHVGPCGSGARMKLVLNLVLGRWTPRAAKC